MEKLKQICLLTVMIIACAPLQGQTQPTGKSEQTKSGPNYQPKEKTRRFLLRYLTFIDTVQTDRQKVNIVTGFETVANSTTDDWISQYHAAYFNATIGLVIADTLLGREMLRKAGGYAGKAAALKKDESEIVLLQAMLSGLKIGQDSAAVNAPDPKRLAGYERARKLNPENPRVYVLLGEYYMGLADDSGKNKKKAKELLELSLTKFESDQHEDKAWPRWGKEKAVRLLATLKK